MPAPVTVVFFVRWCSMAGPIGLPYCIPYVVFVLFSAGDVQTYAQLSARNDPEVACEILRT